MSLDLHKIKPQKGATKKRKRVGRGNASGHGTYSTRGQKGQRARSGGRNKLKIKGFKKALLKFPKLRGFKSLAAKNIEISLSMLDKNFENNAIINPVALKEKGLLESPNEKFKILNNGEVKKSFTIQNCLVSDGAVKKIEKAGGKVEVLVEKEQKEEKKKAVKAGKKTKK